MPPNHSVIWLALYHHVTTSPHQSVICLAPCHQTSQSFDLPSTTTSPCQSVICLAPCHQTTQSFDLPSATASPHHHVSQSFALPPATKPVSHLPCPLPPNQSVIWLSLYHCITASLHHRITASLHHCITTSLHHHVIASPCHCMTASVSHCFAPCHQTSQSFDLPSTTASPRQSVICLAPATEPVSHLHCPHHQTSQSFDFPSTTASPLHHITASPREIFPTTWVWIWLVNTTQHSSDWLIVLTTANQITGIEKPNYHKTLIFSPPPLWKGHMKSE